MSVQTSAFVCKTLDPAAYDAFSATHPQGNFQQTTRMNEVRRRTGVEVEYLGVYRDDELVAATSLEVHKSKLSTFAEVHDGPLCDLENAELTKFLFAELKRRARKAGAAQLSITPELTYCNRDEWGNELPAPGDEPWPANVPAGLDAKPNQAAFDNVVSCGFVHDGFVRDYTAVPRWRFVKDLSGIGSEQELLATYAKNTKRNVRIAQNSCVDVVRIGRDELGVFHDICDMSSERQGFDNRPLEYFELLFDCLGDSAEFYVAYIDARGFRKSWEDKRDEFMREIEHLNKMAEKGPLSPKNEKKLKDRQSKYEASLARIEKAQEYLDSDGERIPAAAAMFVFHPRECVYLFSGSNDKYAKFYAATAIQHRAMLRTMEKGITQYNFYGINGIFDDPSDPGRGLLEFKQGFGGYVQEMMGSFTMPVKPVTFAVKQFVHKVLDR